MNKKKLIIIVCSIVLVVGLGFGIYKLTKLNDTNNNN